MIKQKIARIDRQIDYIETLTEELVLNGFDAKPGDRSVKMNSIFGEFEYKPTYHNIMYDYFRFIMVYGGSLQRYGLEANGGGFKDKKYFKERVTPQNTY